MALQVTERANEVMIQIMNHFWKHHQEYDDKILEESIRILEKDPIDILEEVENNPNLVTKFRLFQLEESEDEVISEEKSEGTIPTDNEMPYVRTNMNRQEPTMDPEEPNFFYPGRPGYFKTEPGESSAQGEQRGKKRRTKEPLFLPTRIKNNTGSSSDNTNLNIDCAENRKQLIDKWAGEIGLIIQTNPEYDTVEKVRALLEHRTSGIANEFIRNTTWTDPRRTSIGEALEEILSAFYAAFLGINYVTDRQNELEKVKNKARTFLTKTQLCDICELGTFNCAYEQNFYKIDQNEWPKFIEMYLTKIPVVGEKVFKDFKEKAQPPMHMSLGYAMKLISEEISKVCELSKTQKRLKKFNKKCCSFLGEPTTEFGCKPEKKYQKKFHKKDFKKKKPFKKYRKKFVPGKYFKKSNTKYKAKICPKGKKNCRCWICSEEGHYANECPNRRQFPNQVKLIEIAKINELEPIEEIYEGYEDIYTFIKEEPPDTTSESESSESSSDESD